MFVCFVFYILFRSDTACGLGVSINTRIYTKFSNLQAELSIPLSTNNI